jgi:hypothetical protein
MCATTHDTNSRYDETQDSGETSRVFDRSSTGTSVFLAFVSTLIVLAMAVSIWKTHDNAQNSNVCTETVGGLVCQP